MIYHKNLKREDLLKYGWKKLLKMAASEFSRAKSMSNNSSKELKSCLLRAKELLAVLETEPSIPSSKWSPLQKLMRIMVDPFKADPKTLYSKAMRIASS